MSIVPDYSVLMLRLRKAAEIERRLCPQSGNEEAVLLDRAAYAIEDLTRIALHFERKASDAVKVEPPCIVIHPLSAGFEKAIDPGMFQDYLQDLVQHYEQKYGSGCVRIETEDGAPRARRRNDGELC